MARFLAGKLAQYAVVLFLALTINFMLPRLMPGGPAQFLLGSETGTATPEIRAAILAELGLDQSMGRQYLAYIRSLLSGDLGYSFTRGERITKVIGDRLPWTVLLASLSLLLSTAAGVALGATAAWRRGRRTDVGLLVFSMFLASMPGFWLGMMFIVVFGVHLGWLPLFGIRTAWASYTGWAAMVDVARHLIMPVVTLSLHSIFGTLMIMRYSMVSVMGEDFVLMARAKGVPARRVMYHHVMRNALLPVVTHFMLGVGFVVGGATIVETVFSYPGVGRLLYEAVLSRDYPVLQATFLIITIFVIVANILADLVYPLLDPRVRRAASA
jgi:peptide/nickel transport system permease protein